MNWQSCLAGRFLFSSLQPFSAAALQRLGVRLLVKPTETDHSWSPFARQRGLRLSPLPWPGQRSWLSTSRSHDTRYRPVRLSHFQSRCFRRARSLFDSPCGEPRVQPVACALAPWPLNPFRLPLPLWDFRPAGSYLFRRRDAGVSTFATLTLNRNAFSEVCCNDPPDLPSLPAAPLSFARSRGSSFQVRYVPSSSLFRVPLGTISMLP